MSEPSLRAVVPDTRLHPIYLIINTAKTLRQAIPYLLVTIFGGAPWWVSASLFGLVMLIATAQWLVRKYSVAGGVLLLRSGVVNRSVRVVPLTRITALEASQSLAQRLVGVWGFAVHVPGDRYGSAVSLTCLSGRRLDELRAALGSVDGAAEPADHESGSGPSTIERYLAWRRTSVASTPGHDVQVVAVLTGVETLIAAVTSYSVLLIFMAGLVVWFRFSYLLPEPAADVMAMVAPDGLIAVLITLVVVALVVSAVRGALWMNRFTLIRDGDVLRIHRGLLGRQSGIVPVQRVQAVRIVEGLGRALLGYCSLQVEVAGIGRVAVKERVLFPLVRADRAEGVIRRALPELPWPSRPLRALPASVRRRYLTLPLGYATGFALPMLILPGPWKLLAAVPLPLGYLLGVTRAREARWAVDDRSVVLRWRRLLSRNTVIAHRDGAQFTEFSSSPKKIKRHVAGFTMRFSSGRRARIRYMAESDALLLMRTVGRADSPSGNSLSPAS
jgi:putative membrane protein